VDQHDVHVNIAVQISAPQWVQARLWHVSDDVSGRRRGACWGGSPRNAPLALSDDAAGLLIALPFSRRHGIWRACRGPDVRRREPRRAPAILPIVMGSSGAGPVAISVSYEIDPTGRRLHHGHPVCAIRLRDGAWWGLFASSADAPLNGRSSSNRGRNISANASG
jgi:hypothetical protein